MIAGPFVAEGFKLPGIIGLVFGGLLLGSYGLNEQREGSRDALGVLPLFFDVGVCWTLPAEPDIGRFFTRNQGRFLDEYKWMRLLLNADDLGYTPAINQAIIELFALGRLSSTSLLVNMPYSRSAVQDLQAHPDLGVGVHLNLTKGSPLLLPKQIPSLVNAMGEFWPTKVFYARVITGQIKIHELEAELRAQIEQVLDHGIRPTHLDSHSHWHLLPFLWRLVAKLAESYQIPGLRQASPRRTLLPSRLWLSAVSRNAPPTFTFRTPDYLLSLHQWIGSEGQPKPLFFSLEFHHLVARPDVILELVTHPGVRDDPDFSPDTLLTYQRQWEFDFLLSPCFDAWLEGMEAEIINCQTSSQ